jgi:hypothetical protein
LRWGLKIQLYPFACTDFQQHLKELNLFAVKKTWVSSTPCVHVPLVVELVEQEVSIPKCVDVLAAAKEKYMGGLPEIDPGDSVDDMLARLEADQQERRAFIAELRQLCFAWPSPQAEQHTQEILVTIFGSCLPSTSCIDFVLLRGTTGHPTCFNPNHLASSAVAGCPARDVAQLLKRLRRGGLETLLPSEKRANESEPGSDSGISDDHDDELLAPSCQSYVRRPPFFVAGGDPALPSGAAAGAAGTTGSLRRSGDSDSAGGAAALPGGAGHRLREVISSSWRFVRRALAPFLDGNGVSRASELVVEADFCA